MAATEVEMSFHVRIKGDHVRHLQFYKDDEEMAKVWPKIYAKGVWDRPFDWATTDHCACHFVSILSYCCCFSQMVHPSFSFCRPHLVLSCEFDRFRANNPFRQPQSITSWAPSVRSPVGFKYIFRVDIGTEGLSNVQQWMSWRFAECWWKRTNWRILSTTSRTTFCNFPQSPG